MSAAALEPEELDAIRAAIQQGTPSAGSRAEDAASPIALIAEDRAAERGRPNGLRLSSRWARQVERQLARLTGSRFTLAVTGVETVDGAAMRGDTTDGWFASVHAGSRGGIIAVNGGLIEAVAARLLGDAAGDAAAERPPSPVARRLFAPAGAAIGTALCEAWHDELGEKVQVAPGDEAWRHAVGDDELVLVVTLASTLPQGLIRLIGRPDLLAGPILAPAQLLPPRAAVDATLGDVPVELLVELGRITLTMAELLDLQPGAVIALDRFVEDAVPIRCGGLIKAFGRPIVSRGALAVEITTVSRAKETP